MKTLMRQLGFTLIELLVTLAMVAIMMSLAGPSFQGLIANQRVSTAASELQSAAMQARGAALKSNQRVVVQPLDGTNSTDGVWKDGWRIYVDISDPPNSTFDSGTDTLVLTHEALPADVSIAKVTGTNNYFGYEGSGFLASIGGSANATWKISSSGTDRVRCLIMERSGRARIYDPRPSTSCPTSTS